ncbi:MAG: M15 family metallopeptidase [Halioglobus sp.]|nr:M15 family metallopeptidase [Halioglobus sp.]
MAEALNRRQLTGLDETHLVTLAGGHRLQSEVALAFTALQSDARRAGFDLTIASSFRPFDRQLAIWNGKADGSRPIYDDQGRLVSIEPLSRTDQLHAILRFSAIPGTSRHHWGTDLDVYDAAAVPSDYPLQLSPVEAGPGGVFDRLHCWLDARLAAGESHGFFRPYGKDRGGVAPERWHLSYAPLSVACAAQFSSATLAFCWACEEVEQEMLLKAEINADLPQIMARYVAVPDDWWIPC